MRFLFCVPRYHTNLYFQVKSLKKERHAVSMVALYKGASEDYSTIEPTVLGYSKLFLFINRIINLSGGKLIKNSFELKYGFPPVFKLWKLIKESKPDVFVIKNIESAFSLLIFFTGLILGKRIIFLTQIPKYRQKERSLSIATVGLLDASVITPVLGDSHLKNKNNNFFYIPFTIEANDFEKDYFVGGNINLLCVGKFQERKDQLLLIKAVNNLRSKYPVTLTLIGQDDEMLYKDRILAYIHDHNLASIINVKPHKDWAGTLELYKDFDIFVLPGYNESASFSLLEAMSRKLVVVSSDDNGTACYIEEGGNGFIFKHKNFEDLKRVLEVLLKDRELIKKAGDKSFELVKKNHSAQSFYYSFMKVIKTNQ